MARALATNGATVYILGRRISKLQEAASSCSSAPGRVIPIECDITSKDSLASAAPSVSQETGYLNLLVANAGVSGPRPDLQPRAVDDPRGPVTLKEAQETLWGMSTDEFVDTHRINVAGPLFTAVAFLDLLDKGNKQENVKQKSQLMITSSIAGFHRGWPVNGLAYNVSKAAVTHLVKNPANFLIQFKIRANGLAPGVFPSEMVTTALGDKDLRIEGSLPESFQPMGRTGLESELAGTVL